MADHTKIEWTDATWNVVTGCSVVSPGCTNCYAMKLAGTRLKHHPSRAGLTKETNGAPVWTGEIRFNEAWLDQPLRWRRPRMIFVAAHGDLFHPDVPVEVQDRIFAVMAAAPWHIYQVLTKRPGHMAGYLDSLQSDRRFRWPHPINGGPIFDISRSLQAALRHIWFGTSIENQRYARNRFQPMAAIADGDFNTWVSYEPALGPVDWVLWNSVKWIVSGGESGPGARPSQASWHREARDFCRSNRIPYFFKQWGNWAPRTNDFMENVGKHAAGALLDGVEWRQVPQAFERMM